MINWHDRYAKLVARERGLFDVRKSVLEVGCGPWGIALWLQRPVVGVERDAVEARNPLIELVQGDVLSLPFDDSSFDYVVCSDVLEHLREGDRGVALTELVRVAREKALVTCPCGPVAEEGDAAFAALLDSLGASSPAWLMEHLENGLPQVGRVLATLAATGYAVEVVGNESRMQHFAGLLLDTALPEAAGWNIEHAAKTVVQPPLGDSPWDRYYSYLFTVDKSRRRRPATKEDPLPPPLTESEKQPTWAVYAVVHDPSLMDDIAPIRYICTGAAASAPLPLLDPEPLIAGAQLPDRRWSELSAMYSVWKEGPVTDIVGFGHYRRLFDFGARAEEGREKRIPRSGIAAAKASFSPADQIALIAGGTVIVASPVDVGEPVFDNYGRYHNANDYLLLLDIVSDLRPELLPFLMEDFESSLLYCNNMFVMTWRLFDQLCAVWFPVLQEWCARAEVTRTWEYQDRDVSFLSERLFSAWVKYVRGRGVHVDERPVFFVDTGLPAAASAADALRLAHEPAAPLDAALRSAEAALEDERARAQALEEELAATAQALTAEKAALTRVAQSTSWRLTAPLREAGRAARRAAGARRRSGPGGPR